jgi:hypothetical protein
MARPRKDRAFGATLREVRLRLGLGVGALTRLMGLSPNRKRDVQRIERGKDSASASFRERSVDVLLPLAKKHGYAISRELFIKGIKACIFKLAVDGAAEGIKSIQEVISPAAGNEASACGDFTVLTVRANAAERTHEWALSLSWFEQAERAAQSPRETLAAQIGQIRSLSNLHMPAAEHRLHNTLSGIGLPATVDMLELGDIQRLIRDEGVLRLLPELLDHAARVYHEREDLDAEDRVRQVVIGLAEQCDDKQTVLRARRRRGGMHTYRLRYARTDAEVASAVQMALPEIRAAFEGLRDSEDRAHAARRFAEALVLGGGADGEIIYYLDAAKEAYGPKSRAVVNALLVQAEHYQRQANGRYAGALDQAAHLEAPAVGAGARSKPEEM